MELHCGRCSTSESRVNDVILWSSVSNFRVDCRIKVKHSSWKSERDTLQEMVVGAKVTVDNLFNRGGTIEGLVHLNVLVSGIHYSPDISEHLGIF